MTFEGTFINNRTHVMLLIQFAKTNRIQFTIKSILIEEISVNLRSCLLINKYEIKEESFSSDRIHLCL